jgi:hypothetical protein
MDRISSSGSSKTEKGWDILINIEPEEPMQELVLRLVWCAGDPRDFDGGMTVGRCVLPRPYASLVRNVEDFSRKRSMCKILKHKAHRPRQRGVGDAT